MFESFDGLPLHPLVVHAVVVLLPLAALGAIVIAVRPVWRRTYGLLVLTAAVVGTALVPVATQSGESLAERRGRPSPHADRGEELIWFALPFLVLLIALVVLDRRAASPAAPSAEATTGGSSATLTHVVAALTVVAAVAVGFQIYRVGEAGARATWGTTLDQPKIPASE